MTADLRGRLALIVITDPGLATPRSVAAVVEEALVAGAPAIQLRDKEATAHALLESARALRALADRYGALLFVNDRLDVALAAGADGVHLGPDDVPVEAARAVVPDGFLIGASTDDPERARSLAHAGADYVGCGTVYPTTTKPDAGSVVGLDGLQSVVDAVSIPVVGIGGVTPERAAEVAGTGAAGAAAIGAVMAADDVGDVVRRLLEPWRAE